MFGIEEIEPTYGPLPGLHRLARELVDQPCGTSPASASGQRLSIASLGLAIEGKPTPAHLAELAQAIRTELTESRGVRLDFSAAD